MNSLSVVRAFVLWLFWYFAPIHQSLLAIAVLVTADLVTGIWASRVKGEPFRSRELRRSLGKIIAYQLAVVLAFFTEPLIGLPAIKIVSGFIALTEFQSAIENIGTITGKNIWGAVLSKLQPGEKKP